MRIEVDGLTFDDEFDSGNLKTVTESQRVDDKFLLYSRPDADGTPFQQRYTTWFNFRVTGYDSGRSVTFVVMNLSPSKLFQLGYRPVYRNASTGNEWRALPQAVTSKKIPKRVNPVTGDDVPAQLHVTWQWTFDGSSETQFAYCYPQSYADCQALLDELEARFSGPRSSLLMRRELLTTSVDGRRIDLVTITGKVGATGRDEELLPGLFPESNDRPPRLDKPVVLMTARVHPAETPGAFLIDGAMRFMLSNDPRAVRLRARYVFMFIPMLNPDGVARGHYRTDNFGRNLNRYYDTPTREEQPTIWAAVRLAEHLQDTGNRLHAYIDYHAHANKRGCFMYGNHYKDDVEQVDAMLLPRLVAMNSPDFDFGGCCFSAKMMSANDRAGMSRTGTSRVGMSQYCRTNMVYTLEANYHTSRTVAPVRAVDGVDPGVTPARPTPYTPETWRGVGRAVCLALLDMHCAEPDVAPLSRVTTRPGAAGAACLDGVRASIRCTMAAKKRHRRTGSSAWQTDEDA